MKLNTDMESIGLEVRARQSLGTSSDAVHRIVVNGRHYPRVLAKLAPPACSDNVLLIGRKPLT
jgi:hypothetical protein